MSAFLFGILALHVMAVSTALLLVASWGEDCER